VMRPHVSRLQTFAVGYAGAAAGFNELGYARRVARDLGTDHHELILGAGAQLDLLPSLLWHYDEPNGEPTSALVYQLAEFTAKRVKVAMSGTGGDEIFAGYPRYRAIRMRERYLQLPRFVRKDLVERVAARWPESTRGARFARRVRRFISGAHLPADAAYLSWVSLMAKDLRADLLDGAVTRAAADPSGEAVLHEYLTAPGDRDLFDRAAALDVGQYLPEYQLTYVDRMSMAHGLEVRAPLSDYQLVNFVTSLPAHYRLKGDHSKHIFKHVSRRWIPAAIAERKKVGFDSPVGQWFKEDLRGFLTGFMAPAHIAQTGLLNPAAVQRVIGDHLTGARDHSLPLWSLLTLEAWHRMYIEDAVVDGRGYRLATLRGAAGGAGAEPGGAAAVPVAVS
jgi:asparagine synthase (glutamine-hydrolysing)